VGPRAGLDAGMDGNIMHSFNRSSLLGFLNFTEVYILRCGLVNILFSSRNIYRKILTNFQNLLYGKQREISKM
jgi:hypothetical protein